MAKIKKKKLGRPKKGKESNGTAVFVNLSPQSKRILTDWKRTFRKSYAKLIDECILTAAGRTPD